MGKDRMHPDGPEKIDFQIIMHLFYSGEVIYKQLMFFCGNGFLVTLK
jgi:hypothetical protein